MQKSKTGRWLGITLALVVLTGCQSNQPKLGGGSSMVTGSSGAAGTKGEASQLVKCDRAIGVATLVGNGYGIGAYGMRGTIEVPGILPTYMTINPYGADLTGGFGNPIPVVKLIMSQSGCFKIVDRGAASMALERERSIAAGGQLQKGSNMGAGQMVAADFIITPSITRNSRNASGGLGALGGLIPGIGGLALAGLSVKNREAQVMLSLTNVRTGVQEAIAEGSASKRDIGFGGLGYYGIGGLGGVYENTDAGKMLAAAFVDAHNNLVEQLRAMPDMLASLDSAGFKTTAQVNLRAGPSTKASVLKSVAPKTSVRHTGAAVGGWWEVDVAGRQGWIHSNYIAR